MGEFFLWCAGSDKSTLKHCPRSERINHIGFGTLVLVPAVLAFVSMTYALSTIEEVRNNLWLAYLGGLLWAAIIFSFDRYIVSTHRRKLNNKDELKSPSFYLRFFFALILGIVISHPIVLLYFEGSIDDKITENVQQEKEQIRLDYENRVKEVENKIAVMDSAFTKKLASRDIQADLVAREIDGEVLKNARGEIVTTGIYGKGPSAENKIRHLEKLEKELQQMRVEDSLQKTALYAEVENLRDKSDSSVAAYSVSFDYLRREMALEQLKDENSIVVATQWLLMLLFVLVDILPVTFKTFSPFGLYDKILLDDSKLVRELDDSGRKKALEEAYRRINGELTALLLFMLFALPGNNISEVAENSVDDQHQQGGSHRQHILLKGHTDTNSR